MTENTIIPPVLALLFAPLMRSVINRTKAVFSGKAGPPMLQPYYELAKLFRKGAVYSSVSGWAIRTGPIVYLAAILVALFLVPIGGAGAPVRFSGDMILFVYLLGLGRFFMIVSAMDAGSSFEGMGASREAFYSALAEPSLLVGLGGLAAITGAISLTPIYAGINHKVMSGGFAPALVFIALAFLIVFLTENARIPVDDPTTHLELTMIHEVMILDHCGIDLAMMEYAGSLKLWVFGLLITGILLPVRTGAPLVDAGAGISGLFVLAVIIGIIESSMARLKLVRIPLLLACAFVLSASGIIWIVR